LDQPWRPITLTPDRTWNSLAGMVIPAAVLIGFAKIRPDQRESLVVVLIVICCASAVLGVMQIASGATGPLYLYRRTYEGVPVGFLGNRNHQAVLLALAFPLMQVWASAHRGAHKAGRTRFGIGLAIALLLLPVILATGSRAGMVLTLVALAATFIVIPKRPRAAGGPAPTGPQRAIKLLVPLLVLGVVALSLYFGRAVSISRLTGGDMIEDDLRFTFFPQVVEIGRQFFPFGTGFGSFDPVFRNFEPDSALSNLFVNQAHNDLLDLFMTTGAAGLLLLLIFLIWLGRRGFAAFFGASRGSSAAAYARLGFVVVAVLLAASLVDYPLRAPLMSAVFTIGCGWLCHRRDRDRRGGEGAR
jgi:O-antigen ligase